MRAVCRRGSTIISNGQTAQNGTSATKCVVLADDPLAVGQLQGQVVARAGSRRGPR